MTRIMAVCLAAFAFEAGAATLSDALKDYGVKVQSADSFKVVKDQKVAGTSKSQHVIEVETAAHERLEIKIIQPVEAKVAAAAIESERNTLKKLYGAAQTPYMGDISQALGGCPASVGPAEAKINLMKKDVAAVLGAVKSDYAFGACSAEQAKFRGAYMAYYDEATKSMWSWRVFAPWTGGGKKPLSADWLKPIVSKFE
jgi:hypothetical protein